jgi:hypothetical protein
MVELWRGGGGRLRYARRSKQSTGEVAEAIVSYLARSASAREAHGAKYCRVLQRNAEFTG